MSFGFNESASAAVDVVVWGVRIYEGSTELPYTPTGVDSIITPVYGSSHNFMMPAAIVHTVATRDLAGSNGTFTPRDGSLHEVDPNGAVNYNPSGTFPKGFELIVINTAGAAETITFDSAGLNQAITQNQRGIFAYNGTSWRKIFVG